MEQPGDLESDALVGRVIAGRYRVDRVLAEGGMGLVVAATHLHLDQPVALKLPRGEIIANADALARFTREARAAAQLKSEHVARVLDAGVTVDGSPYMVMEYLEGQSLAQLIALQGQLDVESATEYAIQVCEGLAEAHARGIVHRDVKPDNLFLVEKAPGRQIVKLIDFGISKLSFAGKGNLETSMIMGSPCYMSPEQLRSTATVDHRTDLWSLGATLFELLAGKGPFDGTMALADLFVSILERPAPNLREVCAEIPEELAATVARCLERNRDLRIQSAADLAMALLPFAPARARDTAERAASMPAILRGSRPPSARSPMVTPVLGAASVRDGDTLQAVPDGIPSALATALSMAPTSIEPPSEDSNASVLAAPLLARFRVAGGAWRRTVLGSPITTIAAGGIAVVLAVALVARHDAQGASSANVTAKAAAVPTPVPAAASSSPLDETQRTSELFVRASPASAKVTVDGVPVSGNPFRRRYPRNEVHVVGATAQGYEAKSEQISLANDVLLDLSLDPRLAVTRTSSSPAPLLHPRRATAAEAPAVAVGSVPAASVPALEVDPSGGRSILHPIEASNPYGTP